MSKAAQALTTPVLRSSQERAPSWGRYAATSESATFRARQEPKAICTPVTEQKSPQHCCGTLLRQQRASTTAPPLADLHQLCDGFSHKTGKQKSVQQFLIMWCWHTSQPNCCSVYFPMHLLNTVYYQMTDMCQLRPKRFHCNLLKCRKSGAGMWQVCNLQTGHQTCPQTVSHRVSPVRNGMFYVQDQELNPLLNMH